MASKDKQPAESGPLPTHFVFNTSCLYKRSGFESGALLGKVFSHVSAGELRELLVDVLQAHVVPRLDQKVQTLAMPTVHNPLRAVYVDGAPVRWTAEAGLGPQLTPATVRVSIEDVMECARKRKIAVPTAA
jgi:hypothetical protein